MITQMANFAIIETTDEYVIIEDLGPWDQYKTITNAAEWVVSDMASYLAGRRLFYLDSERLLDELQHDGLGNFTGFKCAQPEGYTRDSFRR